MKPIFTAAKKAPKRIVYAEGEDERVLRAVQVVVDEGLAKPILVGRPAVHRAAHRALRPAPQAGRRLRDRSIRSTTTRYRDYWTEYYRLTRAQGRLAGVRADRDAPPPHADRRDDDPSRRRRRHAVRHVRHARAASALHRPGDRPAPGRDDLRGDERGDAAQPHGVHRRHLRQSPIRPPSSSPRSRCSPPRRCAASASRRRSRCCRIRASARSDHPSAQEDARALALINAHGPRPRGRRRDARRRRAVARRCARRRSRTRA